MTTSDISRRVTAVETTQAGLAVQAAEIQAAVKTHTGVVQSTSDAVDQLAKHLDESRLFELLPEVADRSSKSGAAADSARHAAERAAAGVDTTVKMASSIESFTSGRLPEVLTSLSRDAKKSLDEAKSAAATSQRSHAAVESMSSEIAELSTAYQATSSAIVAERKTREQAQTALNQRLDQMSADLTNAKAAAETARAAAERTATAAQAQADDVAAIRQVVDSVLSAVTAIARGETKAEVALATDESPTAAGA